MQPLGAYRIATDNAQGFQKLRVVLCKRRVGEGTCQAGYFRAVPVQRAKGGMSMGHVIFSYGALAVYMDWDHVCNAGLPLQPWPDCADSHDRGKRPKGGALE